MEIRAGRGILVNSAVLKQTGQLNFPTNRIYSF